MKVILEEKDMLYITNGKMVRLLHLKTGDAKETTNPTIIQKVLDRGEQVVSPDSKF
jgi:hypothetical protein